MFQQELLEGVVDIHDLQQEVRNTENDKHFHAILAMDGRDYHRRPNYKNGL